MKAPHQMTLEELAQELQSRGYHTRSRLPVDENFPTSKYIVISPHSEKYGFNSRLAVATFVLKVQQGRV